MATYTSDGLLIRGIGGLYTVHLAHTSATPLAGMQADCRACGAFRHAGIKPLCGDHVRVEYTDASFTVGVDGMPVPNGTDMMITSILPRRNALIRPPLANLDFCFVCLAAASPAPMTDMTDKLLCILEHNHIEPIIIIGKSELDPDRAAQILDIYTRAGFPVFTVSCRNGTGTDAVGSYIQTHLNGKIAAFAGASGVGKSTLLKLLAGELTPVSGSVACAARPCYVPQQPDLTGLSVAEALGAAEKIAALRAICAGSTDPVHYDTLGDDWEIEAKCRAALDGWGLHRVGPDTPADTLSGGERTKLLLAGASLRKPEILLLDEPTNHLDEEGRR